MKELNLTLYEIFGYLLPGTITALAVSMMFYILTIPCNLLYLPEMSKTLAVILLGIAYFSGHVAQAMSNLVFKKVHLSEEVVLSSPKGDLPPALVTQIKSILAQAHSIDQGEINARLMYQLCDAYVVQNGNVGDRDIFQYREGFYRGLSLACFLLFLACSLMFFHGVVYIKWAKYCDMEISRKMFAFGCVISIVGSWLFTRRYKRFCQYKILQAVTSFLALKAVSDSPVDDNK